MALPSWPAEHIEFMKGMLVQGASFAEITIELNRKFGTTRTRNATLGKAHRLGICSKHIQVNRGAGRRPSDPNQVKKRATVRTARVKFKPAEPMVNDVGGVVKLRDAPVEPLHIGLLELTSENCHYPYGDERFTFCGHKALESFPYCAPHVALTTKG